MNDKGWLPILHAPEKVVLRTIIWDKDGKRNDQPLVRQGRLWFHPDMRTYVYYTPTHYQLP